MKVLKENKIIGASLSHLIFGCLCYTSGIMAWMRIRNHTSANWMRISILFWENDCRVINEKLLLELPID